MGIRGEGVGDNLGSGSSNSRSARKQRQTMLSVGEGGRASVCVSMIAGVVSGWGGANKSLSVREGGR